MAEITNEFRYAGFWWRVLAYIIDAIILGVAGGIVGGIFGVVAGASAPGDSGAVAVAQGIATLIMVVVNWLYFAILESSSWRATIGKKACGLIVVGEDGHRISFGRATGRYFAKIISAMILMVGFMMAGWNHKKRALHDMIASTYVLKRNPVATPESSAAATLPA